MEKLERPWQSICAKTGLLQCILCAKMILIWQAESCLVSATFKDVEKDLPDHNSPSTRQQKVAGRCFLTLTQPDRAENVPVLIS